MVNCPWRSPQSSELAAGSRFSACTWKHRTLSSSCHHVRADQLHVFGRLKPQGSGRAVCSVLPSYGSRVPPGQRYATFQRRSGVAQDAEQHSTRTDRCGLATWQDLCVAGTGGVERGHGEGVGDGRRWTGAGWRQGPCKRTNRRGLRLFQVLADRGPAVRERERPRPQNKSNTTTITTTTAAADTSIAICPRVRLLPTRALPAPRLEPAVPRSPPRARPAAPLLPPPRGPTPRNHRQRRRPQPSPATVSPSRTSKRPHDAPSARICAAVHPTTTLLVPRIFSFNLYRPL